MKVYTIGLLLLTAAAAMAQQPAADRFIGTVNSIDKDHRSIVLKEDKGSQETISVGEKVSVLRIPPGETDLKKATKITFGDIGVGDRVLAVGAKGASEVEARTIVVMNKADIAQHQEQEQEEWQKRGISGVVASVEPDQSFTVTVGEKKYKVTVSPKTEFRRYAADSAKYSDSKESSFASIKPADQVRVLGNKDDNALTVTAERIVFGTFSRVAGTISSVNAETGEIKLNDLMSRKTVFIQLTPRSTTRKLPEQLANVLAQRLIPNGPNAAPAEGRGGRGGPGGGGLRAGTDLSQMLDRLPAITAADLKPGNAIILTGTPQADATHVTAITVIAGIEPIVSAGSNLVQDLIGGWNIGGGEIEAPQ